MAYELHLRQLSDDELRVFLLLLDVREEHPSYKVSYRELAHRARVVEDDLRGVLTSLSERGYLTYAKHKLTEIQGIPVNIALTAEKDDALRTLQAEHTVVVNQLHAYEHGVDSGLANQFSEPLATTIRTAEDVLQRGVTMREVFHLGELVNRFGPQRVTGQLLKVRAQKNPLRAAYAILMKGGAGSPLKRNEPASEKVEYYQFDPTTDPWS